MVQNGTTNDRQTVTRRKSSLHPVSEHSKNEFGGVGPPMETPKLPSKRTPKDIKTGRRQVVDDMLKPGLILSYFWTLVGGSKAFQIDLRNRKQNQFGDTAKPCDMNNKGERTKARAS